MPTKLFMGVLFDVKSDGSQAHPRSPMCSEHRSPPVVMSYDVLRRLWQCKRCDVTVSDYVVEHMFSEGVTRQRADAGVDLGLFTEAYCRSAYPVQGAASSALLKTLLKGSMRYDAGHKSYVCLRCPSDTFMDYYTDRMLYECRGRSHHRVSRRGWAEAMAECCGKPMAHCAEARVIACVVCGFYVNDSEVLSKARTIVGIDWAQGHFGKNGLRALALVGQTFATAVAAHQFHLRVRPPQIEVLKAPDNFDRATITTFCRRWYRKGSCVWGPELARLGWERLKEIGYPAMMEAWSAELSRRRAVWSDGLRKLTAEADTRRRERERWSNPVQPDDAEACDVGAKDVE